jgi:natural product biosynthesis luciferase-like monooxygenase protein
MTALASLTAAFIGKGQMLVACATQWRLQGGGVHGVISDCPIVSSWCTQNGIDRIAPGANQAAFLSRAPFHYLFSIVNHAITPPAVLALPLKQAINFHDSPLPRYAGFNATSWAIMDGQATHAVTWHTMTADIDGGAILVQQTVDIRDDDTAYSLGVRCAEAAHRSFCQLVDLIAREQREGVPLPATAQGPRQDFHGRAERPGLGLINLQQTAAQVRNFVRGLDLGAEDNWMCRPKLALPTGLVVVGEADLAAGAGAPGTIISVEGGAITVAVADGAVRFSSISNLDGKAVDALAVGARVGLVLDAGAASSAESDLLDAGLSKHERFWVGRLADQRAPMLPELTPQAGAPDAALEVRKLSPQADARAILAAILAYIARTDGEGAFDLGFAKALPEGLRQAYANTAPLRVDIDLAAPFATLCAQADAELAVQQKRGSYARDIVTRYSALRGREVQAPLPVVVRMGDTAIVDPASALAGASIAINVPEQGGEFSLAYDRRAIGDDAIRALADRIETLLNSGLLDKAVAVGKLEILPAAERQLVLADWQATSASYAADRCIHQLFEEQVARTPDATAIVFNGASLTYRQLDERANAVAQVLKERGVGPDSLVAVCVERSLDLVVGLMGVMKAGGAYVPLDPAYPRERLAMMLEDAAPKVLLTRRTISEALFVGASDVLCIEDLAGKTTPIRVVSGVSPGNLAYVIFTSGSTGRPKGVMVEHRNVSNFFTGMDERIGADPGVWLAVTSVSFDISVLELFWTLTRGFEVVIQGEIDRASMTRRSKSVSDAPMAFSLFYFAAGQGDAAPGSAYRLLLEGAKFADTHDFSAIWTPERHFHAFGGIYPNPAVTTAALATITSRIALRAGSVVLPLHNPLRVAEDWSVIDQLSGGRVGLSFASGWHADDFAFMPENYERRREVMLESIETVKKLWRGEKVDVVNGQGKTISVGVLPRPVQAAPPMWIASAGSVDTFKAAGRIGANVLTNMLGQDVDDLRNKFAAYREARREAGYEGAGTITVMLHTFVCEDTEKARELARAPFCNYLKSSFDLIKVAPSMFPAFRQPSLGADGAGNFDAARFTPDDMDALMEHAFDRYFETAGLFGSPEKALAMVDRLKSIGANEVACLIDFGIDVDVVLESLTHLDRLRQMSNPGEVTDASDADYSIAGQIRDRRVTHLQCTPSMARMIASEPEGLAAFGKLKRLMVGGEALPVDLADVLASTVPGEVHNMYGPTETTIWSTTSRVRKGESISIGRPIANTTIRILDARNEATPIGVAGELCIGGAGVVRGYLNKPDMTADRFVADPYSPGEKIYRTGDLARFSRNGNIEFLGRLDHQVKINGYRIELGEVESVIGRHPLVKQVVVSAQTDDGPARLVAYVVPANASTSGSNSERIAHWQGLWDGAYRQANANDARFNVAGWNDSATGEPIPLDQMREWIDATEQSILALSPKRVLEIGCGTGMVLYRVAPYVDHYTGVDLSPHALEAIRTELSGDELKRVTLLQQPAHELANVQDHSYDTVVINSVAQYFPDAAYLQAVLNRAGQIVSDGGRIFVGDIRSLEQLRAFHTNVVLRQSPGHMTGAEVARRIDRRVAQDGELVLSEAFFRAIMRENPRFSRIEVRLKPGSARNEMSAFRYDVVIHVGNTTMADTAKPVVATLSTAAQGLQKDVAVVVPDLVNARLVALHAVQAALDQETATAASLREMLDMQHAGAIDPAAVMAMFPDHDVQTVWARSGDLSRFDAVISRRGVAVDYAPREYAQAPASYANRPAQSADTGAELFDDLRTHARELLPEYMMPSIFVAVKAFPLTPNGKIDRKALPKPTHTVAASTEAYVPPSNDIEQTIANVWKALLGLDQISRRDNIFDLGANSLLTVQANQRLSSLLDRKISLVNMFRYPSIEALAAHLGADQSGAAKAVEARMQERDARKKDAAVRRRELRAAGGS